MISGYNIGSYKENKKKTLLDAKTLELGLMQQQHVYLWAWETRKKWSTTGEKFMLCTIDRLIQLELLSLTFHFPTKIFPLLSSSTLTNQSTVWIRNTLSTVIAKSHEPAAILDCAKQTLKVHTWGWKEFLRVHHPTRGSRSKREKT